MDFGKFIHELLLENEVVIIPGFGAFVSEYKPAEISDDSDEIKPPSKIVTFNQQIRNNDGLLVGLVAERKRISHFDALKYIEKEREEILYKLDSGEQVEISEVGVLAYGENRAIIFKDDSDENLLLDSFGLENTVINDEVEQQVVISEPPLDIEDVLSPEPEKVEGKEEPLEGEVQAVEVEPTPEEKKPEPVSTPIAKAEPQEHEEKKKRSWLWLLLVLIPLVGVSVFVFMQKDDAQITGGAEENGTEVRYVEEPIVQAKDTTAVDSIDTNVMDSVNTTEADLSKPEIKQPALEEKSEAPKYYLVGGSFSVEENAETFLNELKAKGFDAFHVGKKGRFFIVGIASYDTFDEAEKAKKVYMENNPGSEVWVYKK